MEDRPDVRGRGNPAPSELTTLPVKDVTMTERLYVDESTEPSDLVCSVCGYGVARPIPPEHCPMCRERDAWTPMRRRRFGGPSDPAPRSS